MDDGEEMSKKTLLEIHVDVFTMTQMHYVMSDCESSCNSICFIRSIGSTWDENRLTSKKNDYIQTCCIHYHNNKGVY